MARNYQPGTPVLRRGASGLEECLTVTHVSDRQVTFRASDGSRIVKDCNTNVELRFALCGYKVVPVAPKLVFDKVR
jgi:ABC-type Fe3+-hydroxamate transport system substrate-binding protein